MQYCICVACGTQYASTVPPDGCVICNDERQFVPSTGQQWTTLGHLQRTHRNTLRNLEPDLYGIGTEPEFAIGQRALLLRTADGNILWDCIAHLDDATVDVVRALGGLRAIAISHPHFYTTMVEWAHAFDCPVHLHAADRGWVQRPDESLHYWDGESLSSEALNIPGVTLVRCGGHFEGGTVLHWNAGASGRGALLTGDIIQVVQDRRYVSFMRSYPNLIPLNAASIERILAAVESLTYDRIYGAWWGRCIARDAKAAVMRSATRYLNAISQERRARDR